jgi:AcrR family transcriptional regulator
MPSPKRSNASSALAAANEKGNRPRSPEILEAATEAFWRQGYANTSVQDIADAVGLLKGSLYYYIQSKEDLLFAILTEVNEGALRRMQDVAALDVAPLERLRRLIEAQVEYNVANFKAIAVNNHDYGLLGPERRKAILDQRRRYESFVIAQIEAAQAAGEVDPAIDAGLAANFLMGAVNWLYVWYRPGRKSNAAALRQVFGELSVAALRNADGSAVVPRQ